MKNLFSTTRHYLIASVIIFAAGIALYIAAEKGMVKEKAEMPREVTALRWYSEETSFYSDSRFGYSAIFAALKKKYNLNQHYLPWYPDTESNGKIKDNIKTSVIILNPQKEWNETESEELLKYVGRGGIVFLITPDIDSFTNTKKFLKAAKINYDDKARADYKNIFISEPEYFSPTAAGRIYNFQRTALRIDKYFSLQRFMKTYPFTPLLKSPEGNVALSKMQRAEWNGGCIYWLFSVLPCFNGEKKELTFNDVDMIDILEKSGVDTSAIKDESDKSDFAEMQNAKPIAKQGSPEIISSGIVFMERIFAVLGSKNRQVYTFEHLTTGIDSSMSIFSSSAFYAIIIAVIFIFCGIIFFVRSGVPIEVLRRVKFEDRIKRYDYSAIEPFIKNDAKARFAAQFVQAEKYLKRMKEEIK